MRPLNMKIHVSTAVVTIVSMTLCLFQSFAADNSIAYVEFLKKYPISSPIQLGKSESDKKIIYENDAVYIEFGADQFDEFLGLIGEDSALFKEISDKVKISFLKGKKFSLDDDMLPSQLIGSLLQLGKGVILDKKNVNIVKAVVMERFDCEKKFADIEGRKFSSLDNKVLFVAIDRECD